MNPALPVSGTLAWWGTSWLRGLVVADLVVDAVLGDDATHVVAGLPGTDGSVSLVRTLGELRAAAVEGIGLALPGAGDPVGLGGPAEFRPPTRLMADGVPVRVEAPGYAGFVT